MTPPAPGRVGLSLSGGGYRAAAYHLGTLKKLQEMNILEKVDIISSISGGSITAAYYCLNKDDYPSFESTLYKKLQQENVIKKVLLSWFSVPLALILLAFLIPAFYFLFSPYPWLFPILLTALIILLMKLQFTLFPVSRRIETIYDQFGYKGLTLAKLPLRPTLVIGSTNLRTARAFTFSRDWMGDSAYTYRKPPVLFKPDVFPIARAVMASSCVPFAFTPVVIDKVFFNDPAQAKEAAPRLVDGGVYDNQGIHKIVQSGRYVCDTVITSDAGGNPPGSKGSFSNTVQLLLATCNLFMTRIKNAQLVTDVYQNAAGQGRQIAYQSLAWDVENCVAGFIRNLAEKQIPQTVIQAHRLSQAWVQDPDAHLPELTAWLEDAIGYSQIIRPSPEEKNIARKVSTNLTPLTKAQIDSLIKQAAALTEVQVKLYCPILLSAGQTTNNPAPRQTQPV